MSASVLVSCFESCFGFGSVVAVSGSVSLVSDGLPRHSSVFHGVLGFLRSSSVFLGFLASASVFLGLPRPPRSSSVLGLQMVFKIHPYWCWLRLRFWFLVSSFSLCVGFASGFCFGLGSVAAVSDAVSVFRLQFR